MTSIPAAAISLDKLISDSAIPTFSIPASFIPENNEDLGNEITRLAGHINAAQYRFVKLLAVLIERNAWGGGSGIKSPAHWLNYYCGINIGAAREKVRVAKCLPSLPLIDQAFSTGAISYSKVRAMTRTATPQNEDQLLNIAKYGTAQHVESLVRKYQTECGIGLRWCPNSTSQGTGRRRRHSPGAIGGRPASGKTAR